MQDDTAALRVNRSRVLLYLFVSLISLVPAVYAQSGQRKALIIGNSSYSGVSFADLRGVPVKDADAMARALLLVGFDKKNITIADNLDKSAFWSALVNFRDSLTSDDSAVLYFSGHGFSLDKADYLVPTDFEFGTSKSDARSGSVALNQVLSYLAIAKNRVVILDACRTDTPQLKNAIDPSVLSPEGLTPVDGFGNLIAFATSEGRASSAVSTSGLSLYTQFLIDSLKAHPQSMESALADAKERTIEGSQQMQIPAVYDEMGGRFILSGGIAPGPTPIIQTVWVDPNTNIWWTTSDNQGDLSWTQAQDYCSNLTLNEHTDWVLPPQAEIRRLLVNSSASGYYINPAIHISSRYIWTGSILQRQAFKDLYWRADFKNKLGVSGDTTQIARTICMRYDYQANLNRILVLAHGNSLSTLMQNRLDNNDDDVEFYASISLPDSTSSTIWATQVSQRNDGRLNVSGFVYCSVFKDSDPKILANHRASVTAALLATNGIVRNGQADGGDAFVTSDGVDLTLLTLKDSNKVVLRIYSHGTDRQIATDHPLFQREWVGALSSAKRALLCRASPVSSYVLEMRFRPCTVFLHRHDAAMTFMTSHVFASTCKTFLNVDLHPLRTISDFTSLNRHCVRALLPRSLTVEPISSVPSTR